MTPEHLQTLPEMVQLLSILATAFVVGLSGALMPGPVLALTISEASRRGARAGPLLVLGHMILEGLLVLAIALGLVSFIKNPWVMLLIHLLGGAMLGWMGQDMIRSAHRLSLATVQGSKGRMHPVLGGILVSLSNPYWTLWWATIGLSYVVLGLRFGVKGVVFFYVGHVLSDLAWYTFVSVAVAKGRRFMSDRFYRGLLQGCGVLLLGFGAWFICTGLRFEI